MINNVTFQCLQTVISRELGINALEVSKHDKYGYAAWWTSLRHVELMMLLDEHFEIEFTAENAENLTSISAILEVINHAGS